LLVIVESWGHSTTLPSFDAWVRSPLDAQAIRSVYDMETGTVPFNGATAHGELRELCGADGDYGSLTGEEARSCLPAELVRDGYTTFGIHGFFGNMYARRTWWPQIGLQHVYFREDLPVHTSICGYAFPGICDQAVIDFTSRMLAGHDRRFGYVMTLNSHLPLETPTAAQRERDCRFPSAPIDDEECALAASWRNVFRAVAIAALRLKDSPTQIVIVGDHAPPLALGAGANFFSREVVPYLILRPKASATQAGANRAG
jgi:phosphoglycerol transferase MdoB-like AlkP superfamily enzyme